MLPMACDATAAIWKNGTASIFLTAALSFAATSAQASLVISTGATSNVTCTSNSCTQVRGASTAVLNVSQLQAMLALSSVEVAAKSAVAVNAEISWASSSALTLNATRISINKPIVVTGTGGLTLDYQGFDPLLGPKGKITFWSTSSNFKIVTPVSSTSYTLVNSIAMLAGDIAANEGGNYALAGDYDAASDGTYASSPIAIFSGNFLGLNNTISHLMIRDAIAGDRVGLFGTVSGRSNSVSWLKLDGVHVSGAKDSSVGALAGANYGNLLYVSVSGDVSVVKGTAGGAENAVVGGIAGTNYYSIGYSYSAGNISGGANAIVGGIAGENAYYNSIAGDIGGDYSVATVSLQAASCSRNCTGNYENSIGGLVGVNNGYVNGSYAMGSVTGAGGPANVGGLIGLNVSGSENGVSQCYATAVGGSAGSSTGGAIGFDQASGDSKSVYWDTSTSGVSNSNQGAGNIASDPGTTGLTTTQFQSGLPVGFSTEWGESASINGGFPYLLAIPPK